MWQYDLSFHEKRTANKFKKSELKELKPMKHVSQDIWTSFTVL